MDGATRRLGQLAATISASSGQASFGSIRPTLSSTSTTFSPDSRKMADQSGFVQGYGVRPSKPLNTLEHRTYLEDNSGKVISPWHDVPLFDPNDRSILNMVVEIPRWTNAKMEISKEEYMNPIKQDVKKGQLRYVKNCFPHHGYIWNYGAFPQTWEDPNIPHTHTGAKGDNDPLDVCEIGEAVGYTGQVKRVKVLGIMALLDEGETDWKVIVIDVEDPMASKLNDIEDVDWHLPGLIRATNEWFRIYKIPDGKPENNFAFSGEAKNREYATSIIHECHEAWSRLVATPSLAESAGKLSIANVSQAQSADQVGRTQESLAPYQSLPPHELPVPPAPLGSSVAKWYYLSQDPYGKETKKPGHV